MSYLSLTNKDVISLNDGRLLGNITDLIIGDDGIIKCFKVQRHKFLFFFYKEEVIEWTNISKIGKDVILVKESKK